MDKWENMVVKADVKIEDATEFLDKLGAEGWELVCVFPSASGEDVFFFKRRVT